MSELPVLTKEYTYEVKKCKFFLKGEKCTTMLCGYSHQKEVLNRSKRVPTIDISGDIYLQKFEQDVPLPSHQRVGVGNERILKFVVEEGNGNLPTVGKVSMSKCIYRSYGVVYESDEYIAEMRKKSALRGSSYVKKYRQFAENLLHRRSLKLNTGSNGSCSKNAPFYHCMLGTMKNGESAYFKVHPALFDSFAQSKEGIEIPESLKKIPDERRTPKDYIYYFFKVDKLVNPKNGGTVYNEKKKKIDDSFSTYETAMKFVENRFFELNEEKIKIMKKYVEMKKKSEEKSDEREARKMKNQAISWRNEHLKRVTKEYGAVKQKLHSHRVFGSLLKVSDADKVAIVQQKLCSVNLRIANIQLLKDSYMAVEKYCNFTLSIPCGKNLFNARYYKIIALRRLKRWENAGSVLKELQDNVKKGVTVLKDGDLKKLNDEKNFMKKEVDKQKGLEKKLKKKLSEGMKKGFLYGDIEEEILNDLKKQSDLDKKTGKKPWFVYGAEDERGLENESCVYLDKEDDVFEQLSEVNEKVVEPLLKLEEKGNRNGLKFVPHESVHVIEKDDRKKFLEMNEKNAKIVSVKEIKEIEKSQKEKEK